MMANAELCGVRTANGPALAGPLGRRVSRTFTAKGK